MDEETVKTLIYILIIGFAVYLFFKWLMKEPSKEDAEESYERDRLQKEHDLRMMELQQREDELASQPKPVPQPSGKGKVVKARH